jgi:site-specific DNA recombinase
MRAIGYFREGAAENASVAQQNRAFLEFCAREGYEVVGTFVDTSAANGRAPGFRQMLAFLQEGGPEVVVVIPSVEALGAELTEAARRYFQLEGLGAQVMQIGDTTDGTSALLTAWSARDESGNLSDRVRAAMRRKAVKGEVLGRPPYGYKVGNRRRLELVPEEAVVVRYIFRLYLHEGMGIRLIARKLNEEGLKTRRGGNWSMVSIRDILRNRAYLGTYSRFGVRVPGSHPSLVSTDDFNRVQDRLNARRTSFAPRVASKFLLSGIVFCGYCGHSLIGVSRRQSWKRRDGKVMSNSYRYYQCGSRTNQSVCGYHTRRADDLEAEVHRRLAEGFRNGSGFPPPGDEAAVAAEQQRECERLRSRLKLVDKRLGGYVDAAARGRLTRERMRKLSLAAATDRLALEDALEAVESRVEEHFDAAGRGRSRERSLQRLVDDWDKLKFDERQAALRDAVARITVTDDDIDVTLRP